MSNILHTIREVINKWQGVVSVADTPAIALLIMKHHPSVSASLAEHLVRSEIIDRALAARQSELN